MKMAPDYMHLFIYVYFPLQAFNQQPSSSDWSDTEEWDTLPG